MYFFFVICILGGLGVIFSVFGNAENINTKIINISSNLSTYFISIAIPSVILILLSFLSIKNKVSLILIIVMIIISCIFLLYLSNSLHNIWGLLFAFIGALLSWFLWVIANYDNEFLNDESFDRLIKTEIDEKHGGNWDEK